MKQYRSFPETTFGQIALFHQPFINIHIFAYTTKTQVFRA